EVRAARLYDHLRRRDLRPQPAGVADRGEGVVGPVPEHGRDLDVAQVEAPRGGEGQDVVDPAVGGVPDRFGVVLDEPAPDPDIGDDPAVRLGEFVVEAGDELGGI